MKIIYEKEELLSLIKNVLAFNGLKTSGPIVFKAQNGRQPKVVDAYELEVTCEAAPLPGTCPMCGHSLTSSTITSPTTSDKHTTSIKQTTEPPPNTPAPRLDSSLGESLEPPSFDTEDDNKEHGSASIHSIVAQGKRIAREKERTQRQSRKSTPHLMPGESTKPPNF